MCKYVLRNTSSITMSSTFRKELKNTIINFIETMKNELPWLEWFEQGAPNSLQYLKPCSLASDAVGEA